MLDYFTILLFYSWNEPEDELVFENRDSDEEEEWVEEDYSTELRKKTLNARDNDGMTRKEKAKRERQRWNDEEVAEINMYFRSYLDAKVTPRNNAVMKAKAKSKNRNGAIWKRSNDKIIKKISALNHKK